MTFVKCNGMNEATSDSISPRSVECNSNVNCGSTVGKQAADTAEDQSMQFSHHMNTSSHDEHQPHSEPHAQPYIHT